MHLEPIYLLVAPTLAPKFAPSAQEVLDADLFVILDRPSTAENQRHWHYPANFEGAADTTPDRFDRTVSLFLVGLCKACRLGDGRRETPPVENRMEVLGVVRRTYKNVTACVDITTRFIHTC